MSKRNEWLKQAIEQEAAEEFAPYMTQNHEFSPEFQEKIEKLIHPPARKSAWKQTLIQTAAMILLGFIGLFSGYSTALAMDGPTIEAIVEVYDRCVDFIFHRTEEYVPPPDTIETYYGIDPLPEGYRPLLKSENDTGVCRIWGNEQGGLLVLNQDILGSTYTIYAKEDAIATGKVNGDLAYLYQENREYILVWASSEYQFALTYSGPGAENMDLTALAQYVAPMTQSAEAAKTSRPGVK